MIKWILRKLFPSFFNKEEQRETEVEELFYVTWEGHGMMGGFSIPSKEHVDKWQGGVIPHYGGSKQILYGPDTKDKCEAWLKDNRDKY